MSSCDVVMVVVVIHIFAVSVSQKPVSLCILTNHQPVLFVKIPGRIRLLNSAM